MDLVSMLWTTICSPKGDGVREDDVLARNRRADGGFAGEGMA